MCSEAPSPTILEGGTGKVQALALRTGSGTEACQGLDGCHRDDLAAMGTPGQLRHGCSLVNQ